MVKLCKLLLVIFVSVFVSCSSEDTPLYRIQENGLYGFIDSLGTVVIEPQYKYVGHFNQEGYATVITKFQYEYKQYEDSEGTTTDTTLVIRYGFINKSNKLVVDTIHTIELRGVLFHDWGFDGMDINNLVKAFNSNKLNFMTNVYDYNIKLQSGLFCVQDDRTHLMRHMGYMNIRGDTIIPAKYDICHPFYNGVARVSDGMTRLLSIIDYSDVYSTAEVVANAEILIDSLGYEFAVDGYNNIGDFIYEKSWARKVVFSKTKDTMDSYWLLLDKEGNVCSDTIDGMGRQVTIYNGPSEWYIWQCVLMIGDYCVGTYYSFINKDGKLATDWNYDGIWELCHFGDAASKPETFTDVTYMEDNLVGINGYYDETPVWAFANEKFEFVSQPFDSLLQYHDGLAAVKEFSKNKMSKWGFVDKKFEQVIPYKFDNVSSFHDGLAYFCIADIEGYINRKGDVIWSTQKDINACKVENIKTRNDLYSQWIKTGLIVVVIIVVLCFCCTIVIKARNKRKDKKTYIKTSPNKSRPIIDSRDEKFNEQKPSKTSKEKEESIQSTKDIGKAQDNESRKIPNSQLLIKETTQNINPDTLEPIGKSEKLKERVANNEESEKRDFGNNENHIDILKVDYDIPNECQTINDWKYPMVKYPKKGTPVFPRRNVGVARRGYMEEPFQNYLQSVFQNYQLQIIGDCGLLPSDGKRPFEPDIAIIHNLHPSICIDIEIDEPYAAITNKPIHFIGGGDDMRDIRVNNLGWIVIRFAEHQVCADKEACVAFIAQILHTLLPSEDLPKGLLNCPIPKEMDRWEKVDSLVMASEKYREQYLQHEFNEIEENIYTESDLTQTDEESIYAQQIPPISLPENNGLVGKGTIRLKQHVTSQANSGVNIGGLSPHIIDRDNCIKFFPDEHEYIYKGKDTFTPVSTVVSYFFEFFDTFGLSERHAQLRNVPQRKIIEEWDAKGSKARKVGTFMHKQIENAYDELKYETTYPFKYNGKFVQEESLVSLEKEYKQFENFRTNHNFQPYKKEWVIYDEDLEIAGTIDMIHQKDDLYDIYDWKRSSKILDESKKPIMIGYMGKAGINGLEDVQDTSYWHYCIQQNLYRYILENKYEIKVDKMFLVVMIDTIDNYVELEVPRMDKTIEVIIKKCRSGAINSSLPF